MSLSDTSWVHFTRTQWSVVLSAKNADSEERQQALETLCRSYWSPIYAYIRQRGHGPEEAQDLTQDFFTRLLTRNFLDDLVHQNGKFRSFLLAGLNYMLLDECGRKRAQKRGGDRAHIPLEEFVECESSLAEEAGIDQTANGFDRAWAKTVLKRAAQRLEAEYAEQGNKVMFQELKSFASGIATTTSYEELAAKLDMSPGGLRTAVHRMRAKLGHFIREEVRQTISETEDLGEEIRYLIQVVSQK